MDDAQWRTALAESAETAARWVYSAAVYGDIDAQLAYAQMLRDGHGTARDSAAAYRWFEIAARSNRADAINLLGRCHEHGWGVPIDIGIAAAKYRAAAEQSYDWAQFNLACLLLEGAGVARDPDAALALLNAAAAHGHMKSLNMIGLCHENGWGCPPDAKAALHWFHRAAEAGDFRGQYSLGRHLAGRGLIEEALPWLRLAIDNAPSKLCGEITDELRSSGITRLRELADYAEQRSRADAGQLGAVNQ